MLAPSSGLSMFSGNLNTDQKSRLELFCPKLKKRVDKKTKQMQLDNIYSALQEKTKTLLQEMQQALELDHHCLKTGQSALHRLLYRTQVVEMLRNKFIQDQFLKSGGI